MCMCVTGKPLKTLGRAPRQCSKQLPMGFATNKRHILLHVYSTVKVGC